MIGNVQGQPFQMWDGVDKRGKWGKGVKGRGLKMGGGYGVQGVGWERVEMVQGV